MDIGTGLFTCQRRPDGDRSMDTIYEEMLELGRAIDDAGLASAWVSEHHFADDGYMPGTMPSLGALAGATDDVEIGTCIALAPLYDAVRLAEDAATVDLLSGGRMTVGLSIGYRDLEFEAFGAPKAERVDRTVDAVRTLQGAWSDGPLGYDPEYHPVDPDLSVTPKPESDVPIVLGGAARPAVRRAARIADGWVAPSSLSVEDVRTRTDDIETVREEEGIEGEFQTYVIQHGFVGDSEQDAWERIEEGRRYLARTYAGWARGEDVEELPDEQIEELRESAICGTPEQIVEELEAYRDALGDDVHFILRTYYPGVDTDVMVDAVETIGDEVVPHFA
jgi:alkanesulfonate monooxygenase SsuD/methylene tetrahydromethanopterin reductase-like flavin-dependent oxidoreductase (luciferase family)